MTEQRFLERLQGSEKQVKWARELVNEFFLTPMKNNIEWFISHQVDEALQDDARAYQQEVIEQCISYAVKDRWTIKAGEWIKRSRKYHLDEDASVWYWAAVDELRWRLERMLALERGMVLVSDRTYRLVRPFGAHDDLPIYNAIPYREAVLRWKNLTGIAKVKKIPTLEEFIEIRGYRK